MSASFRARVGAIAVGLSGLAMAAAVAQQATTQNQRNPNTPTQGNQAGPRLGQSDVAAPAPDQSRRTSGQQHSANFRAGSEATSNDAVESFFVKCLLKKNQGEIEISQFAMEQSQNPQVKEFAQMLVKDHQQMVDKLQQAAGGTRENATNRTTTTNSQSSIENRTLPGTSATDTATPGIGATAQGAGATATAGVGASSSTSTRQTGQAGSGAIAEVGSIEEKIADRCHQMLREELQGRSGKDFDMCFVGSQIAGHMQMLASLEVLAQESQGELKQIAEDARPRVQQHLDQAKQLAKQLEKGDQEATANRPTRSTDRQ